MKKENKFKPYVYKVYNRNGKLEEYSGYFSTKEEALNWHSKHGKWLENHFKRELILTEEYKQINLFNYVPSTLLIGQGN
jgi:hypothetical protein